MRAIITWLNVAEKTAGINALASRVGPVHSYDWATDVAKVGEESIKDIINEGGRGDNKTQKGGPRRLSDWMYNSVDRDALQMGGLAIADAGYGIKSATPYWTKFQEFGTSRGIKPMESLMEAEVKMEVESLNAGMRFLGAIQAEWNAI